MKRSSPSIHRLHELLELDLDTGFLYWRIGRKGTPAGKRAGSLGKRYGYREIRVDQVLLKEHRVVFAMVHGRWPSGDVDHINGCRSDNRPDNLREATRSMNNCNSRLRRDNKTGYKGVYFHKKRRQFRAYCKVDKREVHLGWFSTAEEAANAASAARSKMHGRFARDG